MTLDYQSIPPSSVEVELVKYNEELWRTIVASFGVPAHLMGGKITTIEDKLLEDVIAYPDDDGPRLILADWWEENGQEERAEFVRIQCDLSQFDEYRFPDCHHCNIDSGHVWCSALARGLNYWMILRQREKELLDASGQDWLLPLARVLGVPLSPGRYKGSRYRYIGTRMLTWGEGGPDCNISWGRGFVAEVKLPLNTWKEHGKNIIKQHPIKVVHLTDKGVWTPLATRPRCAWAVGHGETELSRSFILPPWLGSYLRKYQLEGNTGWRWYESESAAIDDLSQALLRWAKGESS